MSSALITAVAASSLMAFGNAPATRSAAAVPSTRTDLVVAAPKAVTGSCAAAALPAKKKFKMVAVKDANGKVRCSYSLYQGEAAAGAAAAGSAGAATTVTIGAVAAAVAATGVVVGVEASKSN